jgi:hypothetical protein
MPVRAGDGRESGTDPESDPGVYPGRLADTRSNAGSAGSAVAIGSMAATAEF